MKTIKNITIKSALLAVVCLCAATPGNAQLIRQGYLNADWQLNVPLSNGFADKTSGWGMNFEGGYYLNNSDFAIGAFLNYHTNNEYVDWQTIELSSTSALSTDQQHSLFQLPFGVSGRYALSGREGMLQPYISMKLGANYARMSSYYSAFESYEDTWGFYLSPEIGTTIYPSYNRYFGFHIAAYFSYSTNSGKVLTYSVDKLNNFGVRVGVAF